MKLEVTWVMREAILSLFNRQRPEQRPCFSGLISVTQAGLQRSGFTFAEAHQNALRMAEAAASTYHLSGFGSAVVPLDLCVEAEALGAQIDFRANEPRPEFPRVIAPAFNSFDELGTIRRPLPTSRVPVVCDAIHFLKKDLGKEIVIGAFVPGPFTLLSLVMNANDVYTKLRKPADSLEKALAELTEFLIRVAADYHAAGADFITIHEMGGSPGVIGPKRFESIVLPHLQKLIAAWPGPRVLSVCGNTNGMMPLVMQAGADALSVDQTNDLAASRAALGPAALLFGNIDPVGVLAHGTADDVRRAVSNAIAAGVDAIWPGCDLYPLVPEENLKALVAQTHSNQS